MSTFDVSDAGVSPEQERTHPAAQDSLGDALSDPLDDAVQLHELSDVKVHTDDSSPLTAHAQTIHPDVHYKAPHDPSLATEAHEAAHAQQQRGG